MNDGQYLMRWCFTCSERLQHLYWKNEKDVPYVRCGKCGKNTNMTGANFVEDFS